MSSNTTVCGNVGPTEATAAGISWTPPRRELYEWLHARSPGLGDAYHAALTLLCGPQFRGRNRLVCHALRDVAGELPLTVEGRSKSTPTQYANVINKIIPIWPARPPVLSLDGTVPPDSENVLIPFKAYDAINGLVQERKRINKGGSKKASALFIGLMKEFGGTGTVSARVLKEYRELFDWFTNRAHYKDLQSDLPTDGELSERVASFERVLHCFVGDFFAVKGELDLFLALANATPFEAPSGPTVDGVVQLLSHPRHEIYFFDHLQNPRWIEPLNQRGALLPSDPPAAVSGDESPVYSYAPGAQYLARMSAISPDAVCEVFLRFDTHNPWIERYMVEAVAAMPETLASKLVQKMARIVAGANWLNYGKICGICARLASEGAPGPAMELARALFEPDRAKSRAGDHREHHVMEGLVKVLPVLVSSLPREFLGMLCNHLDVVVRARGFRVGDGRADGSYSWRPAIEEHLDNEIHSFEGRLVGKVREGFELAIGSQALSLAEALEILGGYKLVVFERLGIHLVNHFSERDEKLARAMIMDGRFLDDYWYEHEYAVLLTRRFSLLSPREREEWLGRVDAGPDADGREPAEVQKYADHWRFQRYHWVKDYIGGSRAVFHAKMLDEVGDPGPPGMGRRVRAGFVQNPSAYALEDLQKGSFADAVILVVNWRAVGREFGGPTMEGLASVFGKLVASDPLGCSRQAAFLKDRLSLYVRTFIDRIALAVRDGKEIDIAQVLDLCEWVVEQVVEGGVVVDSDMGLVDRGWQWTRDTICRLIENVCDAEADGRRRFLIGEIEASVLKILARLVEGPSHSYLLSKGEKEDPRQTDYVSYAINSPRGMAIEAVMKCARWMANQKKTGEGDSGLFPVGSRRCPRSGTCWNGSWWQEMEVSKCGQWLG